MSYDEFKRRIDTARNILVGAVPSPAGQIDQITFALIYKFMNDIDDKAASLPGGKRKYFIGDYEKYNWHALMAPSLGAQERLELYRQAIQTMSKNEHLPELFRTLYQNAFLPYNSPSVLTMLLKEMDKFTHTDSDDIGDAYEYLLSITGAQGDVGQFRTPRHIIRFIVEAINPGKDDAVLDPACGTAGFLIAAYLHVKRQHDGKDETGKSNHESRLSADELNKLHHNYRGFDIDPTMVRTAKVNMYLHDFKTPEIINHDSLSSEDYWNDKYDVILANPPFMTPKGGIQPHKKFSISANRAEVLFVDYIASHLKPNGRAGIIVPEGILHNNNKATMQMRRALIEAGLWGVVELPHGTFKPYASVKTHILLIDKSKCHDKEILFVKIDNDGFTQTDARKPVDGEELSHALEIIKNFRDNKLINTELLKIEAVDKQLIIDDSITSLVGRRYMLSELAQESKWPSRVLGPSLIEVKKGKSPAEQTQRGKYPFVVTAKDLKTADHYDFNGRAVCVPLVSATGHGHASVRRLHFYDGEFALANIMCAVFVLDESVLLPKYLYHTLSSRKDQLISSLMTGTSNVSMSKDDIYNISIPLPPIKKQEEMVKEIEDIERENMVLSEKIALNNEAIDDISDMSWKSDERA